MPLHNESLGHLAVRQGDMDMLRLLKRYNANLFIPNSNGLYPLDLSNKDETYDLDISEFLRSEMSDVNNVYKRYWTPVHHAVHSGDVNQLYQALNAGADINQIDENAGHPLQHAIKFGSLKMVNALLEQGAIYSEMMNDVIYYGNLDMLIHLYDSSLSDLGNAEYITTKLVARGDKNLLKAYLKQRNEQIQTADGLGLKLFSRFIDVRHLLKLSNEELNHYLKLFEILSNYGASVNIRDNLGCYPLWCLLKNEDGELAKGDRNRERSLFLIEKFIPVWCKFISSFKR